MNGTDVLTPCCVPVRYATGPALDQVLVAGQVSGSRHPHPHLRVAEVFTTEFHAELVRWFNLILGRGAGSDPTRHFVPAGPGHDFSSHVFPFDGYGPFGVFVSRAWVDVVSAAFGMTLSGQVMCGLHHHPAGTRDGFVHHDFHSGWFADLSDADGITVARPDVCGYSTGRVTVPGLRTIQAVPGVAVIYYLDNDGWTPGDGGETGLYSSLDCPVGTPAVAVPPLSNSLVIFECSPRSYHAFMSNRRAPRNSLIAWYNRSPSDAATRWGVAPPVRAASSSAQEPRTDGPGQMQTDHGTI